jgi:type I restriction enzyme S subunit
MTLETFFEKFDLFADAPNAVAKMREMVRNFAVTGKLVPQDSNDEPAEALVARIAAALPDKKSENPFLGEIEDLLTDESEYELPPGWAWLPLGHVGIWATGCGFPMQYQGETDGEFLFCKVSDMNLSGNEVEIHTTVHSIDADAMKKIRARANPVGTVIFPKIGGAIATHKRRLVIKPTIIDNNCSGIQPIGLTDDRWLLMFMRTLDLTKYQSGTSVPAVSQGSLDPIRIGLPPLAEQKRIVAKMDELMALCDRLEAQQQERETRHAALARASLARFADAPTPANLPFLFHPSYDIVPADLRKTILTLAIQGKLVPQDPNDEPAEEVLARIAATKLRLQETGAISKEKPFEQLQPESLPFEAPESWRWAKLTELTELITKGSSPKWQGIAYVPESEGILFITSENVGNYMLRKLDDLKYVAKGFNEIEPRSILKRGDILMNLVGASIGRTAVYDLHNGANINQAVALIRLVRETEGVCPRFLLHYLNSPSAIDYMLSSRVVNAQPNISLTDAREFAVPIPPLAEQRRIVAKVEQLMALVDELETQLAASRATAAKLTSALVAELTTKD